MGNGIFIKVTRLLLRQDLTTTATEMVGSSFFRKYAFILGEGRATLKSYFPEKE